MGAAAPGGQHTQRGARGKTMTKKRNLAGDRFGRYTVLHEAEPDKRGRTHWMCKCECGEVRRVRADALTRGTSLSCGCLAVERTIERSSTHGKTGTPEFVIWSGIMSRCHWKCAENGDKAPDYFGRGIRVCKRWASSFEAFYLDMGPRPSPKHSIDRIDVNGDYSPENCRWATDIQQANNRRDNNLISCFGETRPAREWDRIYGLHPDTVARRIRAGWETSAAITTPPMWKGQRVINHRMGTSALSPSHRTESHDHE